MLPDTVQVVAIGDCVYVNWRRECPDLGEQGLVTNGVFLGVESRMRRMSVPLITKRGRGWMSHRLGKRD